MLDKMAEALLRAVRRSSAYAEIRDEFAQAAKASAAAVAPLPPPNLYLQFAPAGHYYSPIPDHAELVRGQERIFALGKREIPGVAIDAQRFRERIERFAPYYADFPYTDERDPALRFYLDNPTYSRGDAVVLYSMMRLHEPARIIEIGSGMSTWLMIDVNERFLGNRTRLTSIDPYHERMLEGLRPGDRDHIEIIPKRIQDVELERFAVLRAGDIVFVDSTHVSRCDSDVNRIFFDILPALAPGVLVHFHDMFWPFEYPKQWLLEIGAAWNELYLMRAFLQFNSTFEIELFCDYTAHFLRAELERAIPLFLKGPGSSLWLRRAR